jgi:hypothetical protein
VTPVGRHENHYESRALGCFCAGGRVFRGNRVRRVYVELVACSAIDIGGGLWRWQLLSADDGGERVAQAYAFDSETD